VASESSEFVTGNITTDVPIGCVMLQIDDKASIIPLVAGMRREVQMLVAEVSSSCSLYIEVIVKPNVHLTLFILVHHTSRLNCRIIIVNMSASKHSNKETTRHHNSTEP
jgi:hypothetical protein